MHGSKLIETVRNKGDGRDGPPLRRGPALVNADNRPARTRDGQHLTALFILELNPLPKADFNRPFGLVGIFVGDLKNGAVRLSCQKILSGIGTLERVIAPIILTNPELLSQGAVSRINLQQGSICIGTTGNIEIFTRRI